MNESKQTRSLQYQIVDIENEKISWMNIDQNLWRGSNKWVLNNFGHVEVFVSNILEKCIILAFHKNLTFANILLLDCARFNFSTYSLLQLLQFSVLQVPVNLLACAYD